MTGFFAVHLVLTVVSLTLGTIIGVYGIRAPLNRRRQDADAPASDRLHTHEPSSEAPRL